MIACAVLAGASEGAQCHIDPLTGRQICTRAGSEEGAAAAAAGHCRIFVADGSTGSGSLVERAAATGLVLTCAHLFDESESNIVVAFPGGQRFAARLIDRDRAHDLAALVICRPEVVPLAVADAEPVGLLSACGFGPAGQFRRVCGRVVGEATAVGAAYPSLMIGGAVRPGDSGGGVLDAAGKLVGVVWGERDGRTYATCGRPVREFLQRVLSRETRVESRRAGVESREPRAGD